MITLKKILFADLYGTLISENHSTSKKTYDVIDRELFFISHYINEFLRQGNYLIIAVSEPIEIDHSGFWTLKETFNIELTKLYSFIEENLRSHLIYYLTGLERIHLIENMPMEYKNGKVYYTNLDSVSAFHIDKKENIIKDFSNLTKQPYQIYGIGDDCYDIPMLLEILKYGGKSSIIGSSLYNSEYFGRKEYISQIINKQLKIEFKLEREKICSKIESSENFIASDYINLYFHNEEIKALNQRETKRKEELYQLLYEGKLDIDEIHRNYNKFSMCLDYQFHYESPLKRQCNGMFQNYPFNEEIVDSIMNMPCYYSFSEYYTKVLK